MISKKIRFEVFKRDGFLCAYCGNTPPEAILEVDHIEPVSKGGTDDINNLITSCFDCNRGKSNITLDKIPKKISENLEILKEKEEQLKEYRKLIRKIEKRIQKDIDKIEEIFKETYPKKAFEEKFKESTIKNFINKLPLNEVIEAMSLACNRISNKPESTAKYFCGICWNKIRGTKFPFEKD